MKFNISNSELGIMASILISKAAYRKETIIKVMYELTGKYFVLISEEQENFSICITSKNVDTPENELKNVCHELTNDLIDQELRQIVIEETGAIRDAIVKKAFSEASKGLSIPAIKSNYIPNENHSYRDDKKNILELKG
ncbi:TPA: His-Xaa-Ser system protein HxsD [Photobacterium damselae]